ncbi:glyoxalase/bleomycin resistance/extradiol dioxygenase family protein [Lelliottia sp. F153]|uniref:VOC family protein n=1 Tax=unclassified Lelliottia TaxID=2642424 RepID=UPI000C7F5183|nr:MULTISPECIES: VOC family protein [unclassified Lelliottia]AVY96471.1 glyoxalase/bleomycin resistance/extradiol dioxygenase family protein [Lelliottia sp. WB101]PLY46018.1 glyoxalase/bleomycin resistance/extradiol dioxygenase family protein [Lelliottia sp. F159]PLY50391.1 glyoxalase/bleomycin resistance/extradiol dioxygenase family protein [Lelliottia sp. F154]PLY54754.1 glyoxalase/bleomycin resistance/extradiol dioxygenase family protein [Lelliottia sp. F153]
MKIAHVALWTRNLSAQVQFWETVFGGRSNEIYISKNRPGFASHFITLTDGPTIELMTVPELADAPDHLEFVGWAHIALDVGSKANVDRMAEQARQNSTLLSAPRMTGDGFYEAVIADPDGNRIELVGE